MGSARTVTPPPRRRHPKLKMAIVFRGTTQRQTARAAGLDETRLSDFINGRAVPTDEEQARLAHTLKFSRAKLFGDEALP